jgi:hypothetical protein
VTGLATEAEKEQRKKMARKGKRTKGIEKAQPFAGLNRVNPHAAGLDIGSVEIVVCVNGADNTQLVRAFGNYTADLESIGDWLEEHNVKTVAMESTGVYWIPIFEALEARGFECLLISSRSLRRVAGKKRHHGCAMDPDPAQLRLVGKFISPAGRPDCAANLASPSGTVDRTSLAAYPAYPQSTFADERATLSSRQRHYGR